MSSAARRFRRQLVQELARDPSAIAQLTGKVEDLEKITLFILQRLEEKGILKPNEQKTKGGIILPR